MPSRLRAELRELDTIARLGGDEFAILQADVGKPEEVSDLLTRLLAVISEPFDLEGHLVTVGASIGVALAPGDGDDPDRLLKNADMALYRAKAEGKGSFRFFESEMDARVQSRRRLEMDLRAALKDDVFEVHYQPLVDSGDRRGPLARSADPLAASGARHDAAVGLHPGRRGDRPDRAARPVRAAARLRGRGAMAGGRQGRGQPIPDAVQERQSAAGGPRCARAMPACSPTRLELEITETLLLDKSELVTATLHALRALGVHISMDDFGTGYSSLSYLRSFPFDKIKIDRSFVHDIGDNADSQAIVRAIVSLGASLGIKITAEGVETESDLAYLKAEGCTEGQGFLFSKAQPQKEILALLGKAARPGKSGGLARRPPSARR